MRTFSSLTYHAIILRCYGMKYRIILLRVKYSFNAIKYLFWVTAIFIFLFPFILYERAKKNMQLKCPIIKVYILDFILSCR